MITLRCIDPDSTWPLEIEAPGGRVVRLEVRHLSVRDYLRLREMRIDALKAGDDPKVIEATAECLRFAVRRVTDGDATITIDQLLDRISVETLIDAVYRVQGGQRLDAADLGKSGSARPSDAAPSAPRAEVGSA